METVNTYLLESLHGVTLDVDKSIKDLIARHRRNSNSNANVFYIENGVKKFIQQVND